MKKNKNPNIKYKIRGSMLTGVLLVFLMISSISLVIVTRSIHDAKIAKESRQSYRAYQESDENVEARLNNIKNLDNENVGYIPENSPVSSYCPASDSCYDFTDVAIDPTSDKKADQISKVQEKGSEQQTERAVKAPVPRRISLDFDKLKDSFKVNQCGNPANAPGNSCTYNKCDVVISWDTSAAKNEEADEWEIRRSTDKFLDSDPTAKYGWWRAPGTNPVSLATSRMFVENNCDSLVGCVSGDDDYFDSDGQYGQTYYYTIKAKNKRNFELDSLYYYWDKPGGRKKMDDSGGSKQYVKFSNNDACDDGPGGVFVDDLGCVDLAHKPPGVVEANAEYNCCNGTKCYMPDVHWEEDPTEKCTLQKCEYAGDEVGVGGSGDATSGWCGTKEDCQKGRDCSLPYRTIGYCETPRAANTETGFFNNSNWALSNSMKVYQGPDNPTPGNQARCSKHLCPTDGSVTSAAKCGGLPYKGLQWTNTSTCSENNCGPYSYDINCNLECQNRYNETNPNGDYPQGTCCTETCSDVTYIQWGDCIDHSCTENACGDRTVVDNAWSMPTCGAAPTGCACGVSGSCSCNCGGCTDTRKCIDMPTCGAGPSCSCGVEGSCSCDCSGCTDTRTCKECGGGSSGGSSGGGCSAASGCTCSDGSCSWTCC